MKVNSRRSVALDVRGMLAANKWDEGLSDAQIELIISAVVDHLKEDNLTDVYDFMHVTRRQYVNGFVGFVALLESVGE